MQDGAPESEQPALHEHEALPPIGSPDPERAEPDGVVQDWCLDKEEATEQKQQPVKKEKNAE